MAFDQSSYYIFLSLMNLFSLSDCTKSEYDIVIELINRAGDTQYLSIEELSQSSMVSQSTISRFVRKIGFKDYHDFNHNFYKSIAVSQQVRNKEYISQDLNTLLDEQYNQALFNLEATKLNLDIDGLKHIIQIIKDSESSILFGTPESIAHFSRFRKDLIANSFPCFFFYDSRSQSELLKLANKDVCILFITLSNDYLTLFNDRIKKYKEKGAKLILLTQDAPDESTQSFDYVYTYGISNSFRYGDYSLEYIATVLSSILVKSLYE